MRVHSFFLPALVLAVDVLFLTPLASAGSATWSENPVTGDWNTPANWTPATVPNGPSDTASFALSNTTALSLSADVEVNSVAFELGASSFTITVASHTFTVSGAGILNNSAAMQQFVAGSDGFINFTNSATAGMSDISNSGAATQTTSGGTTSFFGRATAGQATVTNNAGSGFYSAGGATTFAGFSSAGDAVFLNKTAAFAYSGTVTFAGHATAADASFTSEGGDSNSLSYAMVTFTGRANAGNATFENLGSIGELGYPAYLEFYGSATAGRATITNEGSQGNDALGGRADFSDLTNAGNSTIVLNGGLVPAGAGGEVSFNGTSTAAQSTLIANDAGVAQANGGLILFFEDSSGGAARIEVFGIGTLEIGYHNAPGVTVGSLEGDGIVSLGGNNLTIGANNLDASFSGLIEDELSNTGGSISKTGTGKLTLSSANTYRRGTRITNGTLLVSNKTGSATGSREVYVDAGTLGGTGKIAGPVYLGTGTGAGAFVSPGENANKPGRLTVSRAVAFASDSTYECALNRDLMKATQIAANGVTINGAQFVFADSGTGTLTNGQVFVVINNNSTSQIKGQFANLPDGSTFTSSGGTTFLVSYEGGTGNDLTLTVQ